MPRSSPPAQISLAEMARQTGAVLRRGDSAHFQQGLPPTLAELTESLLFSPGDGRIWLNDQRMLLLHSSAMGHLRRELIDTLGQERARGLLTRAGYVAGARDAQLVRERWPEGDAASVFMAGTRLHALEGMVKVTPLTFAFDIDEPQRFNEFGYRDPGGTMLTILERATHRGIASHTSSCGSFVGFDLPSRDFASSENFWGTARSAGGDLSRCRNVPNSAMFHDTTTSTAPRLASGT